MDQLILRRNEQDLARALIFRTLENTVDRRHGLRQRITDQYLMDFASQVSA